MIKIYRWRPWENEAKALVFELLQSAKQFLIDFHNCSLNYRFLMHAYVHADFTYLDAAQDKTNLQRMRRSSTFTVHHAFHPWSQHTVFVFLLCFSRQFWSSIN